MATVVTLDTVPSEKRARWKTWFSRGVWAVADEGLFAGANFILNIALARLLIPDDYGAFTVAYTVFLYLGLVHTSMLTEPMLVFGSGRYNDDFESYLLRVLRGHGVFSLLAGIILAVIGGACWLAGSPALATAIGCLAISQSCILLLWLLRHACIVRSNPRPAAIAGFCYLLLMIAGIATLYRLQQLTIIGAITVMGVSTLICAYGLMRASGVSIRRVMRATILPGNCTEHWHYGKWVLGTGYVRSIPGFLPLLVLPLVGTFADSGALKALMNLAMPFIMGAAALSTLLVPVFVRLRQSPNYRKTVLITLAALGAAPLLFWLPLGLLHRPIISILYGGHYVEYSHLLWLVGLVPVLTAMTSVLGAHIRAAERPDLLFYGSIVAAIVAVAVGVPLMLSHGVGGVLVAMLASYLAQTIALLWISQRMLLPKTGESLDERPASWKVLLPAGGDGRALVVGGTMGDVVALSRNWRQVDRQANSEPYDLVVCADSAAQLEPLLKHLKSDGCFVCVNRGIPGRLLRRGGFKNVRRYAMLPAGEPRIIFPLRNHHVRDAGLSFHQPSSRRSILKVRVARMLSQLGMTWHLTRASVTIAMRSNRETLLDRLSKGLGRDVTDIAIYTGSDEPHRKMTVMPIFEDGPSSMMVKLADSPGGVRAIQQEVETLDALTLANAPRARWQEKWGGFVIAGQTNMPGTDTACEQRLTDHHLKLLASLVRMDHHMKPAGRTALWRVVQAMDEDSLPAIVSKVREQVMAWGEHQLVTCHRTHGDFAPWNIRACEDGINVIDWEDSDPAGVVFTDVFHFVFRQASLAGPWGGVRQVFENMRQSAEALAQKTSLETDNLNWILALWCLHEYQSHEQTRPHMMEILDLLTKELSARQQSYAPVAS